LTRKGTIRRIFRRNGQAEEADVLKQVLSDDAVSQANQADELAWEAYEPQRELPAAVSERLWQRIYAQIEEKAAIYYLKRVAVAASVILVLGAAAYVLFMKQQPSVPANIALAKSTLRTIHNHTQEPMMVTLADSSSVWLMAQSALSYADSFAANRQVSLSGEGYFEVKKDAAHPFVVRADSIAITVLGTIFTVQAYADQAETKVLLHEGKVAVKRQHGQLLFKGGKAEYILLPGDIFVLNRATNKVSIVNSLRRKPLEIPRRKLDLPADSLANEVLQGDNWYMFNNQSLAQVFDHLGAMYHTSISYNKADIKGMTFIGKIDNTDTLPNILNTIALLNNLRVIKVQDGYLIKR
jgi:ferric-dicitrate binding protein FerR (iron transport regulator)